MQPSPNAPAAAPIPTLPGLRQDLKLLPGEPQSDGAPSWRIHDPARNRFFEIGWIEFELLQRWREGAGLEQLIAEVAATTPLRPTADELETLVAFLDRHELLTPSTASRRDRLNQRRAAGKASIGKQLLHHYLFFRIPVLHPDAWLDRNAHKLTWVFDRTFMTVTLIGGLLGMFLAGRQSAAVASAFGYFFNLEGLAFYAFATVVAKVLHEFGHALGAKRYGLRVPTVGVAFLVMMPVLYTDTSESWKLTNRRDRFGVAVAGIAAELALAAWTTLAWAVTPDGALRSAFFLLATTTWVWTLAINASPFMRFDGYFLLSDMVGLPNLHERSSALARRLLRATLFGYETVDPEPALRRSTQRAMIAFALATWIYRLVIFLGIALLVYTYFFKLLGIFLMAVEVSWFVALPIGREIMTIVKERAQWRPRPAPWLMILAVLAALLWLLPISHQVTAPALARALHDSTVFASSSARVLEVRVRPGQAVRQGDTLLQLQSPDLVSRAQRAHLRTEGYTVEVARASASRSSLERRLVLEQQLGEAMADETGALAEIAALKIVAPHDGYVRDMPSDLVPGRWVNVRHPLMRIVDAGACKIEAFFSESQIAGLKIGQPVSFYPDAPALAPIDGAIVAIDETTGRAVPHPMLASVHGGAITATQSARDALVAHEAIYRVRIQAAAEAAGVAQVARGSVRIQADWWAVTWAGISRVASVLVRESGF